MVACPEEKQFWGRLVPYFVTKGHVPLPVAVDDINQGPMVKQKTYRILLLKICML